MEEVIFIDQYGNIIQHKEICSHVALAIKLINENTELKNIYINKDYPRADLFLIVNIGYMSVSIDPIYGMNITANTKIISNIQKEILNNYLICGAKLSSVDKEIDSKTLTGKHKKILKK